MPDFVDRPRRSSAPPSSPPLLNPQLPLAPQLPPVHVVDLMTLTGSAAFGATWRGREAKIIEIPSLIDSRPEFKTTYDIEPHAELAGFDDSDWEIVQPDDLGGRRGGGQISFFWYRTSLTIPASAAGFETAGAMAVLRINIDDYAEIWIDHELPRLAGRPSPNLIQGFNMPNRMVLGASMSPGQKFNVAVFAINGPISAAPLNFLWFREAKVEFYR